MQSGLLNHNYGVINSTLLKMSRAFWHNKRHWSHNKVVRQVECLLFYYRSTQAQLVICQIVFGYTAFLDTRIAKKFSLIYTFLISTFWYSAIALTLSLLVFGSLVCVQIMCVSDGYRKKQIPYYSVHNVVMKFPNYVVVFPLSSLTNSWSCLGECRG